MVKNKVFFYLGVIFLMIAMVLNFPFPHTIPYGEAVLSVLNIPVRSANGFHYVGITTLFLFFSGLYLLAKSLNKHHVRFIMLALIITISFPPFLVSLYQKTMATGIYAISYEQDTSNCSFNMKNKKTLRGICEFTFENYSKNDVQFEIIFSEQYPFEEDVRMISLMSYGSPYEVMLKGKERKRIKIESDIDLSKMENHIDSDEATIVNIIIKQGEKSRKL